jgi:hypothetical protein
MVEHLAFDTIGWHHMSVWRMYSLNVISSSVKVFVRFVTDEIGYSFRAMPDANGLV